MCVSSQFADFLHSSGAQLELAQPVSRAVNEVKQERSYALPAVVSYAGFADADFVLVFAGEDSADCVDSLPGSISPPSFFINCPMRFLYSSRRSAF